MDAADSKRTEAERGPDRRTGDERRVVTDDYTGPDRRKAVRRNIPDRRD